MLANNLLCETKDKSFQQEWRRFKHWSGGDRATWSQRRRCCYTERNLSKWCERQYMRRSNQSNKASLWPPRFSNSQVWRIRSRNSWFPICLITNVKGEIVWSALHTLRYWRHQHRRFLCTIMEKQKVPATSGQWLGHHYFRHSEKSSCTWSMSTIIYGCNFSHSTTTIQISFHYTWRVLQTSITSSHCTYDK
jgi:hypothetical protein